MLPKAAALEPLQENVGTEPHGSGEGGWRRRLRRSRSGGLAAGVDSGAERSNGVGA